MGFYVTKLNRCFSDTVAGRRRTVTRGCLLNGLLYIPFDFDAVAVDAAQIVEHSGSFDNSNCVGELEFHLAMQTAESLFSAPNARSTVDRQRLSL